MAPEGSRFEERGGIPVLTFPIFDGHPVSVAVTTVEGGVSTGPYESLNLGLHVGDDPVAVVENRRRAARAIDLDLADLVFCNQTHGRMVVTVDAQDRGLGTTDLADAIDGADALVTSTPDVGLAVLVADCVPIVLYHPTGALACVHAGWRGTAARIAEAAVEVLGAAGAPPGEVLAAIGPAVAAERYQVGPEVAAAVADAFAGPVDVLRADPAEEGRWLLDLQAANRQVLLDAGLDPANVAAADVPTGAPGRFFSDRARRPCGRFAALARLC